MLAENLPPTGESDQSSENPDKQAMEDFLKQLNTLDQSPDGPAIRAAMIQWGEDHAITSKYLADPTLEEIFDDIKGCYINQQKARNGDKDPSSDEDTSALIWMRQLFQAITKEIPKDPEKAKIFNKIRALIPQQPEKNDVAVSKELQIQDLEVEIQDLIGQKSRLEQNYKNALSEAAAAYRNLTPIRKEMEKARAVLINTLQLYNFNYGYSRGADDDKYNDRNSNFHFHFNSDELGTRQLHPDPDAKPNFDIPVIDKLIIVRYPETYLKLPQVYRKQINDNVDQKQNTYDEKNLLLELAYNTAKEKAKQENYAHIQYTDAVKISDAKIVEKKQTLALLRKPANA